DVFPMVTALKLFGVPAVQFVPRLQLPLPTFQLSGVSGGRAWGANANRRLTNDGARVPVTTNARNQAGFAGLEPSCAWVIPAKTPGRRYAMPAAIRRHFM